MKTEGGFIIHKVPLIRTALAAHTAALPHPVSEADLRATNLVQSVPWRINQRVLAVATTAFDAGLQIAGLPLADIEPMPSRIDDAVWVAMPEDGQKQIVGIRREAHERRVIAISKRQSTIDKLSIASEMQNYDEIWYPHSRDFRGRMYPIPASGPHPQSDGLGRNLIEFARGCELGPDGLFWLYVRAANAAGQDKLTLEARATWVVENAELIRETADRPLEDRRWADLDSPWEFLATAFEISEAWELEDQTEYVSHLPMPLDGTCNGLQHLSAMGLDPVGAWATNLTSQGERQDIYQHVADIVARQVELDAAAGKPEAYGWLGKVSRKTVKRAVMTTPYGVTDQGIRTQLIADGMVPVEGAERGPAADYLRDQLVSALSQTIEAGKSIMAWLQASAHALAKAGLYFEWPTPSGSLVRQAYHVLLSQTVRTLCGRLNLDTEDTSGMLNAKKQALGSAPNVVHSFDAAHLALTVNALADDGVRDFAMIHDSFGTHAGNTTHMAHVLRRVFADIYKEDWLQSIADYVKTYAPHVELPPVPARGSFNIEDVEQAQFFFS